MPENEIFNEESQLSEYTSILLVACVQVKLSAVKVRLFLAKITLSYIERNLFHKGLTDTGSPTLFKYVHVGYLVFTMW